MNIFDIHGKKALVTGASRGLGRGMAEALLEAGAMVVICGTHEEALQKQAAEYRAKGHVCHALAIDLANRENRRAAFEKGVALLDGRIDILVNAAGVQRRHPCEEFPLEEWDDVLEVNLTAVFDLCRLAGRKMIAQGGGKIINIASMLTFFGGFTVPAYAASKGGVGQLTKALGNEWAAKNIQVNALAPGYMATDMNTALLEDESRNTEILARIPAKRWGTAADMRGPVLFLASAASDYLSGAIIPVDGGYLTR
ncbi:MAG: 2-dehydro-3-deoxy-D-gluconate 5-dehydrogenase [Desulfovibrio sp.]